MEKLSFNHKWRVYDEKGQRGTVQDHRQIKRGLERLEDRKRGSTPQASGKVTWFGKSQEAD